LLPQPVNRLDPTTTTVWKSLVRPTTRS
jgi:hypothetical protein